MPGETNRLLVPLDSVELLRPPFSLKADNFSIAQAENFVCHLVKKPTTFKVANRKTIWDYADRIL